MRRFAHAIPPQFAQEGCGVNLPGPLVQLIERNVISHGILGVVTAADPKICHKYLKLLVIVSILEPISAGGSGGKFNWVEKSNAAGLFRLGKTINTL